MIPYELTEYERVEGRWRIAPDIGVSQGEGAFLSPIEIVRAVRHRLRPPDGEKSFGVLVTFDAVVLFLTTSFIGPDGVTVLDSVTGERYVLGPKPEGSAV